jgi:hypothetical protein
MDEAKGESPEFTTESTESTHHLGRGSPATRRLTRGARLPWAAMGTGDDPGADRLLVPPPIRNLTTPLRALRASVAIPLCRTFAA